MDPQEWAVRHVWPGGRVADAAGMHLHVRAVPRAAILALALVVVAFLQGCASVQMRSDRPAISDLSMTVYRSPDCSCCHVWADFARAEGWTVATADVIDLAGFKADHGVPIEAASCHTAVVDGYIVEGHVPLAAITRLLAERPDIDGIALPGMPAGSPGMGGIATGPFEILALDGGELSVFGSY
jgi:hypothetical protein